jgi:leucyl/phenylalanyl-tRNA--protein transferase
MKQLPWLEDTGGIFPPASEAFDEPNGLLCAGGQLEPEILLSAYSQGIFPWFDDDQPILWWSPDPRMIIEIDSFKASRSVRKLIRRGGFSFSLDTAFEQVVAGCAAPRSDDNGTWITHEMRRAYLRLHHLGFAHSVEVWQESELVGGLYGVAIGSQFFGESMFSKTSNASKAALTILVEQLSRWGFALIDCQVANPHLESLGAIEIQRSDFLARIAVTCSTSRQQTHWNLDPDLTHSRGNGDPLSQKVAL